MRTAEENTEALIIGAFLFMMASIVLVVVLLDRHGAFPKRSTPMPFAAMPRGAGPAPAQTSELIRIQASLENYAVLAGKDVGGSAAAARIRAVLQQIQQNGRQSFAGRASVYVADLSHRRDCPAGADLLSIQYIASSSFMLGKVEVIDSAGGIIAQAVDPGARRMPLGAGIEHRFMVLYVVPSQIAPSEQASSELLQKKVLPARSTMHLRQSVGQLRVRVVGQNGFRSDPIPIIVPALPATRPAKRLPAGVDR